ncbi:MAG: hypothetical protein R3B90_02715 [Planctomycetaceae bacterium]
MSDAALATRTGDPESFHDEQDRGTEDRGRRPRPLDEQTLVQAGRMLDHLRAAGGGRPP